MAHETLAPWAELVPDTGPMTVDQLLALPQDEPWIYELVDGRLVRMPLSGGEASRIALRLGAALLTFVEDRGLGAVTTADGEYDLTQPGDAAETAPGTSRRTSRQRSFRPISTARRWRPRRSDTSPPGCG
jgi:hypothetical protein